MFRFIAFVSESRDRAILERARSVARPFRASARWTCDVNTDRLQVFHREGRGSACGSLPVQRCGAILGTLFERTRLLESNPRPLKELSSERASEAIAKSAGRSLITQYWGRYVAFLENADSDGVHVIRDPSGHLPCYRVRHAGMCVYFSSLGDCLQIADLRLSLNRDYLMVRLIRGNMQSKHTGLVGVEEILPGECESVRDGSVRNELYWDPTVLAHEQSIEDPDDAARQLRGTLKGCVRHWAACYPGILHRLSGGLDSSIVLGGLRDAPQRPDITCLTFHPRSMEADVDPDERDFARAAATASGCPLIELPRTPAQSLQRMLQMGPFPSPVILNGRNVEENEIERRLAKERGALARFGGEGGDQVFFQAPMLATVGDYVRRHGVGLSLFQIAWDVAHREQRSVWEVLLKGLQEGFSHVPWKPDEDVLRAAEFISPDILKRVAEDASLLRRFSHPWLQAAPNLPHGKLWHILWLSVPPRFYAPLDEENDPERVEPLTSQPLVELCVRIPTFILAAGARDRALARRAFAADVPATVLARRTKGSMEGFIRKTLLLNLPFIRERLLDGVLAQDGILDRDRLSAALSGQPERMASAPVRVFDLLGFEAWASHWRHGYGSGERLDRGLSAGALA